ncbi:MAG: sensor histidine kinase [Chlamydiia bacterium]|jgi:two-component system phosphate regulon sensor histidine kinase PhoR
MITLILLFAFILSFSWGITLSRQLKISKMERKEEGLVLRQERLDVGRDFVANASHELRTPITIIKGFLETMRDMPEISQDLFSEILKKMLKSCERMESLVKSLLLLADLENCPKGGFEDCDLVQIIDEVSYNLISIHQEATIETYLKDSSIRIWANLDLLELALRNLLENAVKYSKGAARIAIRLEVGEQSCKIKIKDEGMGIPEKDLPHLFDRFYTVDKTHSRRLGGAGLGLSIVKKIVENHRGEISVFSKHQEWTEFVMELPLASHLSLAEMYATYREPQVVT